MFKEKKGLYSIKKIYFKHSGTRIIKKPKKILFDINIYNVLYRNERAEKIANIIIKIKSFIQDQIIIIKNINLYYIN